MKILISGDFCPVLRAKNALLNNEVFDKDFVSLFKNADLNITNLECPLTESTEKINKSGPALKAEPVMAEALKSYDFDLVTLANNHIMDYGSSGLKDTLTYLDHNGVKHVGADKSDSCKDIFYHEINNVKVAIINICENEWSTIPRQNYVANGFSEIESFYSLKQAKEKADHVIVIHHGGFEMYHLPSPRLKKTLRFFIDCGADVVINHHTHCISVSEVYNDKKIYYSLGNFVFDNPKYKDSIWNYGMMVKLILTKDTIETKDYFFKQFGESPKLEMFTKSDLPFDLDKLYHVFKNDELLEKSFKDFIAKKRKMYKTYLEPLKSKYYNALVLRKILPSLWNAQKRITLSNLVRCESHREALIEIFKNENSNT